MGHSQIVHVQTYAHILGIRARYPDLDALIADARGSRVPSMFPDEAENG